MFDVTAIGEICIDLVGIVNTLPKENTKKDISSFRQIVGGSASNTIIALSSLGLNTSFIGKVGSDAYGNFIKKEFIKAGVNVDNIKDDLSYTPYHFVVLSKKNQSRTIFKRKNNNAFVERLSDFDRFVISKSKAVIMDRKTDKIGLEVLQIAKKNKVVVSFDPSDKYDEYTKEVIKKTDILIAPHGFIKHLKNNHDKYAALKELWSLNKGIAVITLGPDGCIATNGNKIVEAPRYNKAKVVDTNGAGDIFHGAFVYGIIRRWPLDKVCQFANKIAALKCSIVGNDLKKLNLKKYT